MSEWRYYLSRDTETLSPPTDELFRVRAETKANAVETLRQNGHVPRGLASGMGAFSRLVQRERLAARL